MTTGTQHDGYPIFVMIELARIWELIDPDLEYDSTWDEGIRLYKEFFDSSYNDELKPEYDCMEDFLRDMR